MDTKRLRLQTVRRPVEVPGRLGGTARTLLARVAGSVVRILRLKRSGARANPEDPARWAYLSNIRNIGPRL